MMTIALCIIGGSILGGIITLVLFGAIGMSEAHEYPPTKTIDNRSVIEAQKQVKS